MSILRHSFQIVSKQLAYLIIFALIVLIVCLGTVSWLSNEVEQRQDEIAIWVGDNIGYPVIIGDAGLTWLGATPKLRLAAVNILSKDSTERILSFSDLYVGLDLFSSVRQGKPVLNDITLTGLKLSVERNTVGEVKIKGFDLLENTADDQDLLSWLQLLNRFNLQLTINYEDKFTPSLSGLYYLTNTTINHGKDAWNAKGNIQLPSSLGTKIQFQAKTNPINGDGSAYEWQWKAETKGLKLEALAYEFVRNDLVEMGIADVALSAKGQDYSFTSLIGDLDVSDVKLISQQQEKHTSTNIEHLSGHLDWERRDDSWQLLGRNIHVKMNDDVWPETNFTFNRNSDDSWAIASKYLRLSDITAVTSLLKSPPEIFVRQKPAGDVEQFNLHVTENSEIKWLAFNLRDGALEAWNDTPGLTGLTMKVNWENNAAHIDVDSHDLSVYADNVLEKAVFLDSAIGVVRLQKNQNSWELESQQLRIWNDDLTLQLDGSIKQDANGDIFNDISLKIEELSVENWHNYLPQGILNKELEAWIRPAFPAGNIVAGVIDWKGALSEFPYKNKTDKGYFKMVLLVEGVQLHYADGWPDLFGVDAEVTGRGHDLVIKSQKGKIAEFDFVNVITNITKLNESKPTLNLKGELTGTSKKALSFLQNSPLKERFGEVAKTIGIAGNSNINLELMVPLTNVDATEVTGDVSFIDSELRLQSKSKIDAKLTQINGLLYFENNGVHASEIKADLFNEPVKISVEPKGENTVVSMLGNVSTKKINKLWPESVPDFIHGKTAYQVNATVQEKSLGDFYVDYDLISDLKGIKIDMPEPFLKNIKQARPFKITMENTDKGPVFSSKYTNIVNVIAIPNKENWRGAIRFGKEQAKLPSHGIKIRGNVTELSLDDWLAWSKKGVSANKNTIVESIDDISMTIDTLTGFEQKLTGLNYSVNKDGQGWRIAMHSDQTRGNIYWPSDFNAVAPLEIQLDTLVLTLPKKKEKPKSENKSDVALWPAMKIDVGTLQVNKFNLGKLSLRASRKTDLWTVDSASLISNVFSAKVIGEKTFWQHLPLGQRSKVLIELSSPDLAGLLENFDYQKTIDAKQTNIDVDLTWPSYPLDFSAGNIAGNIKIDVGKGKLTDIEPGAAGRIFGLMSVAALPRRLSLDFSDLFSSGFSFDSIKGDFNFANGLAVTDNFELKSASANIDITGAVDLVNQSYDQQVKVTPNVSSTLPLAGAVAGGPVGAAIGAGLWALDKVSGKLFGKNIVNLISYKYKLTGPWDDPKLNNTKEVKATKNTQTDVFKNPVTIK